MFLPLNVSQNSQLSRSFTRQTADWIDLKKQQQCSETQGRWGEVTHQFIAKYPNTFIISKFGCHCFMYNVHHFWSAFHSCIFIRQTVQLNSSELSILLVLSVSASLTLLYHHDWLWFIYLIPTCPYGISSSLLPFLFISYFLDVHSCIKYKFIITVKSLT